MKTLNFRRTIGLVVARGIFAIANANGQNDSLVPARIKPQRINNNFDRIPFCETNDWAFSLRKIVDKDSKYVCLDDCENLGKWPTCLGSQEYFVDVGAYFLPTSIAIQISPLWYRRARHPDEQPEVDRIIMQVLLEQGFSYDTNGKYTLNYRVGNREDSVKADFFIWGNSVMEKKFKDGYPWRKK